MDSKHATIDRNLQAIRARIAGAAHRAERSPQEVRLVAVTKSIGVMEAKALYELGVRDMAENRVEVARPKLEALHPPDLCWHMIGNLQRRKVREAVRHFDRADAIDRLSLARALQDRCDEAGRTMACLVEVNVSGETTKHGFTPDGLGPALLELRAFDCLTVEGLLTMAPWGAEEAAIRRVFRNLRELGQAHGLKELSMGMTDDFELAIEEGATQVRIGRALFE